MLKKKYGDAEKRREKHFVLRATTGILKNHIDAIAGFFHGLFDRAEVLQEAFGMLSAFCISLASF